MTLYLVRHGESIANTKKLVTGDCHDALSQKGKIQAQTLKKFLIKENLKVDKYFTSQWRRAQETAEILYDNVIWKVDNRLGETDAGIVKNFSLEEFIRQYKDFYKDNSYKYPQGESHLDLYNRVISWFDEILINCHKDDKVMLVAHSGPISCILQYIKKVDMKNFPAYKPENASLTSIDIKDNLLINAKIIEFSFLPENI